MSDGTVTRSAGVGLRSERGPVLAAVMLTVGLVAIDSTIIATAVPAVVRDLGGFSQFPWLFSVYLLTTAVTTPLYGKLSDMVGRRPVMFAGIAVFLIGSVLCGAAWNMLSLIVFRAIQGDRLTHVLQAPKLTVFNGQRAAVQCIEQTSFVTGIVPRPLMENGATTDDTDEISTGTALVLVSVTVRLTVVFLGTSPKLS